jgi:hypothetical protein
MNTAANRTKRFHALFYFMLMAVLVLPSCAGSKSGYGKKKYKKRKCGDCPSWSYIKPALDESVCVYHGV